MSREQDELERWAQYARALSGEATPTDADALRRVLAADAERAAEFDAAASTWHATAPGVTTASAAQAATATTTDAAWARLLTASGANRTAAADADQQASTGYLRTIRTRAGWSVAMAAGLLIMVGTGTWRLLDTASDRQWTTYSALPGQRATISLADGSEVVLRGGSTMRVAGRARFEALAALRGQANASVRAVELDGEAVFTVVHDAAHPFRVVAGSGVIEDVGTRFNVRAYASEPGVHVTVAEGAVTIGHRAPDAALLDAAPRTTPLHAGDMAALDDAGIIRVSHVDDPAALLAWTTGRLVVRDRQLADVARDLSRSFGANVAIDAPSLAERRVTMDMPLTTLESAVRMLAAVLDLTAERAGDGYVLRATKPPTK
jgi:transmembrane sensor